MAIFLRNVTFHGIQLDSLLMDGEKEWSEVKALFTAGLKEGVVQPLETTVFGKHKVVNAFRYMAQRKHIGKVLIEVNFVVLDICEHWNVYNIFSRYL